MTTMSASIEQKSSSDLTLNELVFCYQYCTFVKSQNRTSPHAVLIEAFLEDHPLPRDVDYPMEWSKDESRRNEADDRFLQLVDSLPTTNKRKDSFFWRTAKHVAWYLAVGFASHQLLGHLGVSAAPSALATRDPVSFSDVVLYPKGLHLDQVTGHEFQLYMLNDELDDVAAFESYLSAYLDQPKVTKRDWYDCQFPRQHNLLKFCCNTGHALGTFVSSTGSAAAGGYINSLLQEAFNGKRDNKSPRSVCLSRDGHNLCISWATYNTEVTTGAEDADIVKYSVQCAQSGGSAEFKTSTGSNGLLFICVSDRAKGCEQSVG
jgi:hypothetical protein